MSKPRVAITGAGGFVGQELIKHFVQLGWHVRALVRDPSKYQPMQQVEYVSYDMARPITAATLKSVDYLIHTAYVKFDKRHPEAFAVNVDGSLALYKAARQAKVKKMLFLSSMSAHDEAVSVYGKQKLAIERVFTGEQAVVFRSGLIIGNGGIVKEMMDFLKTKRLVPLVDGGRQPLQIIAVGDLVVAIGNALTSGLHGRFTVANPHVYEYRELYEAIGAKMGVKILFIQMPFRLLLLMVRIASLIHIPLPINEDNLWGLKMLRSADNTNDMEKLRITADDLEASLNRSIAM